MGNSFFRFKQFTIYQHRAAMKVCTDACLFGSLLPQKKYSRALDIGTGTGLLALMFAQKHPQCKIDAVEIERGAAWQAKQNFENTLWKNNFRLFEEDIVSFAERTDEQYDIVFSNPPFYENHLKSGKSEKDLAHHSTFLGQQQLAAVVAKLLAAKGVFCVLLPCASAQNFMRPAAMCGLYVCKKISVRQTKSHAPFREILFFSRTEKKVVFKEIIIRKKDGSYTEEFVALLKNYYLYL